MSLNFMDISVLVTGEGQAKIMLSWGFLELFFVELAGAISWPLSNSGKLLALVVVVVVVIIV
jgi:hypothetical protein